MSVTRPHRQVSMDNEYYINIGQLTNKIFAIGLGGGVGTTTGVTPVAALWASTTSAAAGATTVALTAVSTAGSALLRDEGRTYVSAGRSFRKVQLVVPQGSNGSTSTFGVAGSAGTSLPNQDYFSGYIEVGFDAASGTTPTPVAKWGR